MDWSLFNPSKFAAIDIISHFFYYTHGRMTKCASPHNEFKKKYYAKNVTILKINHFNI